MILAGQTALVTGGSRGLGRAIAARLAKDGAAVCVNYASRADAAESIVNEIRAAGGRAIAVKADISDVSRVKAMVDGTASELGPVSILVNNAGTFYRALLEDFEPSEMERMRRTNVDGLIQVTKSVIPGMKDRGYGRIINLSSIAAHGTAFPGTSFYAATKAAVVALTKRFAFEFGAHGITVNAVAPGFIVTDMAEEVAGAEFDQLVKRLSSITMTGRVGRPEDVANAVAFLAAPDSGFITAQTLTVDGGRMDFIGHC
jgi:NAD(P)-dependent dehydrogenase (short-subunit alcohol dehydrogenase family)